MLRLACMVCLLAGCDVVWRLDDLRSTHDGGTTGSGDAPTTGDGSQSTIDAPAGCFVEPFAGGTLKTTWTFVQTDPRIDVTQADLIDVDLALAQNLDTDAEGGIASTSRWNMTGATLTVEVPQSTVATNIETYVAAWIDPNNGYVIDVTGGNLGFAARSSNANQGASRTYSAANDRFWRLDFATAGSVAFSTSADGVTFSGVTYSATTPLTSLHIRLAVHNYPPGAANPGRADFDNFVLCNATEN